MTDASLIQIPIGQGLDESVDDLRTPAGRLRRAQNVVFRSQNTASKRYGFLTVPGQGLVGGSVPTRLKRIINCNGSPAVTDGQNLYGYTPAASGGFQNHGRVSPCIATRRELSPGYTRSAQADPITGAVYGQIVAYTIAEANGMRCIVWTIAAPAAGGGGTYAQVLDATTGEAVTTATRLNNNAPIGAVPRPYILRACGNGTLIQVAIADASNNFILIQYDTVARAWSAPSTTAFGAAFIFDMAQNIGTTEFFATLVNVSTGAISVTRYSSAMGSLAGSTVATVSNVAGIAIRAVASERVWLSWVLNFSGSTQHVDAVTLNTTSTAVVTGPFTVFAVSPNVTPSIQMLGIERTGPTNACVVLGIAGYGIEWGNLSTTAGLDQNGFITVGTASESCRYLTMAKPFMGPNGRVYQLTIMNPIVGPDGNGYGASMVLLELNPGTSVIALPAAVAAARSAANDYSLGTHYSLCDISNIGDQTQTRYRVLGLAVNSSGYTGISELSFDFAHVGLNQAVTLGETTYLCGGTLMSYDRQKITDTGFTAQPKRCDNLPGPGSSTTGGNLGKNAYKYISLYRYRTTRGETDNCLPPTFDPLTVDLTGSATTTNQAFVRVHCLNAATYKQDGTSVGNPVIIDLYRNAFIGGVDSGNYYKCASIVNLPLQPTIDFIDSMGDDVLSTQPLLYTTGGALEADCPPSIRFLCVHNQRLFGIGDEQNVIWYTTTHVVGEKPRWNDALKLNVPSGDGSLVGLASLDGRLFAFTSTALYIFTGDGPNDTGAGESWGVATKMPFGLGLTDPRAICSTPMGIVFMTSKGLYLYDRSGQVQWIGERIQRTLAAYPFITSIVHYEADGYVLVSLSPSSNPITVAGVTMCWDYRHDVWTTWSIGSDAGAGLASVSAESVGGTYYSVFNGTVLGVSGVSIAMYSPGNYTDGSAGGWITMVISTGWISQQDLQSYGRIARIQLVGQFRGQHGLVLIKYVDYSATPDSSVTFPVANVLGSTIEQVRTGLVQQKCQAVSMTIADQLDFAHLDTGQSVDLEGILFKLRPRGNEYKRLGTGQAG